MDNAQMPPDSDDRKGDLARRGGRRLSDVEAVATVRRDMFGDGSLLNALAPAVSEPSADAPADGAQAPISGESVAPEQPVAAATSGTTDTERAPAEVRLPGLLAYVPQSLDSFIDSLPPEPGWPPPTAPDGEQSGPVFLAPLQRSTAPNWVDEAEQRTEEARPGAQPDSDAPAAIGPDNPQPEEPAPYADGDAADLSDYASPAPEHEHRPDHAHLNGDAGPADSAANAAAEEATVENGAKPPVEQPPAPGREFATPPFPPGLSEADAAAYADSGSMPTFAAPLQIGRPMTSPEPLVPPPFTTPDEVLGFRETEVSPPPPLFESFESEVGTMAETAATPMFDAAAKIAAEANATAEALDNLKRLLMDSVPTAHGDLHAVGPPNGPNVHLYLQGDPARFSTVDPAPMLPLPLPPERGSGKVVYLLGFLTGIGLAVTAGLALYFLINMG